VSNFVKPGGIFQRDFNVTTLSLPPSDCSTPIVLLPPIVGVKPQMRRVMMAGAGAVTVAIQSLGPPPLRTYALGLPLPTSYHRMNEAAGNIADSSPSGIVGTAGGAPTYSRPGLMISDPDTSIGFGGVADYFDLGNPVPMQFTNEASLFGVFKYGGAPGAFASDYTLMTHGDPFADWAFHAQLQSGTTGLSFYMFDNTGAGLINGTYGGGLDVGIHTYGWSYSVANALYEIYIDGLVVGSAAVANPMRVPVVNPNVLIGAAFYGGVPGPFYLGDIQPIMTWASSRSQSEMAQLHALATGTTPSFLYLTPGIPLGTGPFTPPPFDVGQYPGVVGGNIQIAGSNATLVSAILEVLN